MYKQRMLPLAFCALFLTAARGMGAVDSSEFFSGPLDEGWTVAAIDCRPITWVANGSYFQDLDSGDCPPEYIAMQDTYTRFIDEFNDSDEWFYEYRVFTTGSRDDITFTAPAALVVANAFASSYHTTIARDQVRWDAEPYPLLFVDVDPAVPHTFRFEITNSDPPVYKWFIDGIIHDQNIAKDVYPSHNPVMSFRGKSQLEPTLNEWYYIRWGTIPILSSADFNSDGQVDQFEIFYIAECIERSAAGEPADPSCSWADVSGDNTVTCADWEIIKESFWTGPPANPPPMFPCGEGAIPTTSNWGLGVMALLTATAGTLFFRRYATHG